MKVTLRTDFRVQATLQAQDLTVFGLGGVPGRIISGDITVTIAPDRLGDFGFMSLPDSRVSSDFERDYMRRCDDILDTLSLKHSVKSGLITCTETHLCSHCDLRWEELTDEIIASHPDLKQDEHSIPGEPLCCTAAVVEFRAEHGIPALLEETR